MNLGRLLDARVLDDAGDAVGRVVDVRLELEVLDDVGSGAPQDDAAMSERTRPRVRVGDARLVGLLVSPRRAGSFLGFERTGVRSPWLVAAPVRARHRGTVLVPWEDVTDVADGVVRLARGYRRGDPALP